MRCPAIASACLAAGMDAYVPKPLRPDDLLSTIDGFFTAKPGDAAGAAASPPAGQPRASTIDVDALLENLGQNRKLLAEVITVFLSETPKQLATLRAAADAPALAAAAHAIKGSVGLFAKGEAFDAARRLEHGGAPRRPDRPRRAPWRHRTRIGPCVRGPRDVSCAPHPRDGRLAAVGVSPFGPALRSPS